MANEKFSDNRISRNPVFFFLLFMFCTCQDRNAIFGIDFRVHMSMTKTLFQLVQLNNSWVH